MTTVQLTIPFANTLKLSEKHKCTLISSQAKRLALNEWEIASLIQLCKNKGWVSKGLALLYKYSGHVDELQELLNLFYHHLEEIINYSSLNIVETLGRISLIVVRIYYSISNWRKIQLSPRLIFLEENGRKHSLSRYIGSKIRLILEYLRKVSNLIRADLKNSLLKDIIVNVFGEQILLLTEETSLIDYDWLSSPSSSNSSATSKYFIKRSLLQIIQNEELILMKWEEYEERWPVNATLLLPYPEVKRSLAPMNWFVNLFESYQTSIEILSSVLEETLLIHSTMSQLDHVFGVLQSLSDDKFKSYFKDHSLSTENGDQNNPNDEANAILIQEINPLLITFPDSKHKILPQPSPLTKPTNRSSPTPRSDESSLKSEVERPHKGSQELTVKVEEEARSVVTENLVSSNTAPKPKSNNNNASALSLNSTESTLSNLLFSPKFASPDRRVPIPTPIPEPTSISETDKNDLTSDILQEVSVNNRSNSTVAISPTSRSVDEKENEEITHQTENLAKGPKIMAEPLSPSKLLKSSTVNFNDESNDIIYYLEENSHVSNSRSETPHRQNQNNRDDERGLERHRAQSADYLHQIQNDGSYHADDRNFFNRQRIISDPRGLSVDRYVRSFQVNKGRKTKRFDQAVNQIYQYGKYKRADFSFTSLAAALKNVDNEMTRYAREQKGSIEALVRKTAVKKIEIWYLIMSPRKKLLKRLLHRNMMLDIVYSIIDQSYNIALIRHRRRKHMLRLGAAIKIQRNYKAWVKRMQEEEAKQEQEERKQAVEYYLAIWVRAVKAGIRIFRYLRFLVKKKIIHTKLPTPISTPPLSRNRFMLPGTPSSGNGGIQPTGLSLVRILENYINALVIHRRFDIKMQLQNNKLLRYDNNPSDPSQRRVKLFREYGAAVILIQSVVRSYLQRRRFFLMKQNSAMISRVAIFLSRAMRYRRRKQLELVHNAATKIQRFIRGILIRRKIYQIVHAGLKLNFMWRKYVAYKALKGQLRRVDRPYTIILHGLRDLPKKYLTSDQIKFKISVWWNPLLHIVSKNDFNVILQSKQPQYIYISNPFKVMDVSSSHQNHIGLLDPNNPNSSSGFSNGEDPNEVSQSSILGNNHHSLIQYPTPLPKTTPSKKKFGNFFANSFSRISRPMTPNENKISPEETIDDRAHVSNIKTPERPRTGYLNPFNYGRKHGTKTDDFGHIPIEQEKKLQIKPTPQPSHDLSNRLVIGPAEHDTEQRDRPHQDTGISLPPTHSTTTVTPHVSTPAGRKNSKKRSIRMSQNILPPSSLLQMALTEEDEEEDDDDDDDDEEAEDDVQKENEDEGKGKSEISLYDNTTTKDSSFNTPMRRATNISKRNTVIESPFLPESNNELGTPLTPPRGRESPRLRHFTPVKGSSSVASNSDSEVESLDNFNMNERLGTGIARQPRSRTASILQTLHSAFTRASDQNDQGDEDLENNTVSSGGKTARQRTSMLFSNLPSARSTRASVVRTTINFALKLRSMVQKTQSNNVKLDCMCNFEETTVKIPGCHGNSVFKFEILEGERKISHCFFYLGKEGEMMYWGGEYQLEMRTVAPQRRAAHSNRMSADEIAKISRRNSNPMEFSHEPKIDFRVIAGAPLRSRCQWARVIVRGKGPLKRTINNRDFMNSFNLFDHWNRFYLSLDQFGLHLFENKFCSTAFFTIPAADFRTIRVELGFPIRDATFDIQRGIDLVSRMFSGGRGSFNSSSNNLIGRDSKAAASAIKSRAGTAGGGNGEGDKAVLEDIHNVILTTSLGDEVYMR